MAQRASLAKISRPRLFSVVARERLYAVLDENRGRPLVWINGPPGAGKTALVASYLEARELPTIWYQIDAGDADPATLFHYLALAAEVFDATNSNSLPRFVAEHLSDLPSFARLFFRAFFAQLPARLALVLDNYQEAPGDALLHQILCQAIAEVPPESSVIAISRVEAPPAFVQLAASGAMVGVGWDKLQLTVDEVRAIAAQRKITDDWLVRALHQQSQGWAAGITLMLERLGHFDGKTQELPSDTRESVFNYFASLIFDQASEETRHILLSIAFLPRVTSKLAREMSGRPEAHALLENFYRRRMFTDRRTGADPVYQFHALFLEFLRTKARASLVPQVLDQLRERSAIALHQAGDIEAEMEIWIESGKWDEANRLILNEARALLIAGRRQTLISWIESTPDSVRCRSPRLLYWLGRAQLQTSPEQGSITLAQSIRLFRQCDDRHGHIEALAAMLVGAFIGFRALNSMNDWLDELLVQMQREPVFESLDQELEVWGVLCMSLFHVRPWHPLMMPAYKRVEELLPHSSDPSTSLVAAMHALVVSGLCGDFERGNRIAQYTESHALKATASPPEAAWSFAQVGWLRFVEARYEAALESLDRGYRIAKSNDLRAVMRQILLWRYTIEWRAIGWPAANVTMAEIETIAGSRQPMTEAQLHLFTSRWATQRGRRDEAAELALLSQEAANRTGSRLEELIFCLSNADVLLDAERSEEASTLLLQSGRLTEQAEIYDCWRAAQLFMEAGLALKKNERGHARDRLQQALKLAKEGSQKYYLRFSDWAMTLLFRVALEEGIEVDFVQDLIRMFRLKAPNDAPDLWPWPVRIFTLGRFEVQVNDEPVEFSRKLPRKTLLLLKAIVAYGGRDVPEQALCDALWGDEEGDAAKNSLSITILRLRKLLGSNETIVHSGGKVSLNSECCWVDAWAFEARVAEDEPLGRKALDLYGGSFLPEDEGEPWSVAARERLRGKFIHALSTHGTQLEAAADYQGALDCYLRGIDADPVVETFYQGLMRTYERMGKRSEAFSVYRRLKQTLSVVLGVPPTDATTLLFQQMLGQQSAEGLDGVGEPRKVLKLSDAHKRQR